MGTTVTSRGAQTVTQTDTQKAPETTPQPVQKTVEEPQNNARTTEGLKQHAAENKSTQDMQSQMLRNQLASNIDPSFRNLAEQMARSGKADPASATIALQQTWKNLPISTHGPIAYEVAKNLTDKDLDTLSKTSEGREFLRTVENGMLDGNVEPAHQSQIDRIRQAGLSQAQPPKELSTSLLNQATGSGPVKAPWLANELTKEIGKDLTSGARTANQVLDKALPADRARIAAELTKSLSADQLQELAKTPEGRKLIDRMSAANIPYAELKKLASVPDGEKDPLKRSEKAMVMAERMARAAGPKDQDDAIAMLARTKKQLVADGHRHVFERGLNSMAIQQLLGPFGLRHMEGPGNQLMNAHLDSFDDAVRNWEKMKPADREMVRNRLRFPHHQPPMGKPSHDYDKVEKQAKANDTNQTVKQLPDGTVYNGPLSGLKDAEIAAKNRVLIAQKQDMQKDGPFALAGRAIGAGIDHFAGTNVQPYLVGAGKGLDLMTPRATARAYAINTPKPTVQHHAPTNAPKSEAKSEQHSNVGTSHTQQAPKPKVENQSNVGTSHTQQAPQRPPEPAKSKAPQAGRTDGTIDSTNAGNANPKVQRGSDGRLTFRRGDNWFTLFPLPGDSKVYTINTLRGPEKMTGQEYRLRVMEAEKWVTDQHYKENHRKGVGPSEELHRKAQERFGLDKNWWQRNFNGIMKDIIRG